MQEPFSTIQVRNAKALLRDMCVDINVTPLDNRSDVERCCDIIIMRVQAANLPETFTDNLITTINRKTLSAIMEAVTLLEDTIKEAEK